MIKIALIVIILIIPFAIAYFIFTGQGSKITETIIPKQESSDSRIYGDIKIEDLKLKAPVKPIFAYLYRPKQATASGYVRLSWVAGKILIQLKSDDTTDKIGMIFKGRCNGSGEIVYPLASLKEGKSQTIWETNMEQIEKNLPLSIKVFKEIKDLKTYTRCADLKV